MGCLFSRFKKNKQLPTDVFDSEETIGLDDEDRNEARVWDALYTKWVNDPDT